MGYSIRTLNAIPAGNDQHSAITMNFFFPGAVVSEFVGELIPEAEFAEEDSDFAYTVIHNTEKITKQLRAMLGDTEKKKGVIQWSEAKWMEHAALMKSNWILNPKWFGNISRTYGHSCAPNLMPVRVFQKGFLPTQVRMVLVAMCDIFPGTEVSLVILFKKVFFFFSSQLITANSISREHWKITACVEHCRAPVQDYLH